MKQVSLELVGFGNVGQAFAHLILKKEQELAEQYGISLIVTGIATGRHGNALCSGGINLPRALETIQRGQSLSLVSEIPAPENTVDLIYASFANVMIETSPVNQYTGQPEIDHIKAALQNMV